MPRHGRAPSRGSPASTTPTSRRRTRRSRSQPTVRHPRNRRHGSSTCWRRGGTSMSPNVAPADVGDLPDLEGASAEYILTWAIERFFPEIAVACSMQDAVLVDLAWRVEPRIEIFFLETGFHFPETLETAQKMRDRYKLNLVALRPGPDPAVYSRDGYEACCAARKVAPMEAHLLGKRAWASGLRRVESPTRSTAKAVQWDAKPGLVKANPIVARTG